jgi:hypothetical protein
MLPLAAIGWVIWRWGHDGDWHQFVAAPPTTRAHCETEVELLRGVQGLRSEEGRVILTCDLKKPNWRPEKPGKPWAIAPVGWVTWTWNQDGDWHQLKDLNEPIKLTTRAYCEAGVELMSQVQVLKSEEDRTIFTCDTKKPNWQPEKPGDMLPPTSKGWVIWRRVPNEQRYAPDIRGEWLQFAPTKITTRAYCETEVELLREVQVIED